MYAILRSMKAELKLLATTIREKKKSGDYVYPQRVEFRHKHFVYCLLRGRTPEEIEHKNRQDNVRQQYLVERYWLQYVGKAYPERPECPVVHPDSQESASCTSGGTE
jgi:hypothetical protein